MQDSRSLLAQRDEEIARLKQELERFKQHAAREVANKTKLAQTLDESHRHAAEVEETLKEWRLVMRESQQQVEQLQVSPAHFAENNYHEDLNCFKCDFIAQTVTF